MSRTTPVALSIAGSDSGGGAGVQADLRVFSKLGVFGTTAITAVTAQNLDGVHAVEGLPVELVVAQIEAAFGGFPVVAVKTGMLWSTAVVHGVANVLEEAAGVAVVVDPVMVATTGSRLVERDAIDALRRELIPRCTVLTPNLDEAAVLLERGPIEPAELEDVARELAREHGCHVLLKGGHLEGDPVDVLCVGGERLLRMAHERVERVNSHGTGCMLSAAIVAFLSLGRDIESACVEAIDFVHEALRTPHDLSNGVRLAGIERVAPAIASSRHRP